MRWPVSHLLTHAPAHGFWVAHKLVCCIQSTHLKWWTSEESIFNLDITKGSSHISLHLYARVVRSLLGFFHEPWMIMRDSYVRISASFRLNQFYVPPYLSRGSLLLYVVPWNSFASSSDITLKNRTGQSLLVQQISLWNAKKHQTRSS